MATCWDAGRADKRRRVRGIEMWGSERMIRTQRRVIPASIWLPVSQELVLISRRDDFKGLCIWSLRRRRDIKELSSFYLIDWADCVAVIRIFNQGVRLLREMMRNWQFEAVAQCEGVTVGWLLALMNFQQRLLNIFFLCILIRNHC